MASNEEKGTIIKGGMAFTLDMLRSLEAGENSFFSPASIALAMAMTYLGCQGETKAEMSRVLHFPSGETEPVLHQVLKQFMSTLNQSSAGLEVRAANRLYMEKQYKLLDSYLSDCKRHYSAQPVSVDFQTQAEQVTETINAWVKETTAGKISQLIPSGTLNALTRLVLVNAVYFKGDWKEKFKESRTEKRPFYLTGGAEKMVPTMHMSEKFRYTQSTSLGVSALELPYVSGSMALLVILPKKREGLAEVMAKLTPENLQELEQNMPKDKQTVDVALPKFKQEQTLDLKKTFKDMGMTQLFSETQCDLSGVDGTRQLFVSDIIHKAFIEVNEEGSEAAAATVVETGMRSVPLSPIPNAKFTADHPFLFFLRHTDTGHTLFAGKVMDGGIKV